MWGRSGRFGRLVGVPLAALMVATVAGYAGPDVVQAAPAAPAQPSSTFPPIADWLPVFEDEFDGRFNDQPITDNRNLLGAPGADGLDDRVWQYTRTYGTDPEAISRTDDAQGRDPGQPADGYLHLRAYSEPTGDGLRRFAPRWIATGDNATTPPEQLFGTTYGYAEARVNKVNADGGFNAFWMYSQDLHWWHGEPLRDPANAGIEVDIMEDWGDHQIHSNLHWDGYGPAHQTEQTGPISCPGTPCNQGFHTYGVLWDPSGYRFFIDGQETRFYPRGVSHRPLFLLIGLLHDPDRDLGPKGDPRNALTLVDYVKVWQPAMSGLPDVQTQPNVPVSIPFNVSSIATKDASVPAPRASTVPVGSANTNVVANSNLVVTGTGADRTLTVMPHASGTATILAIVQDAGGQQLGFDTFTVTAGTSPAQPPELAPGALPDLPMEASRPAPVGLRTRIAEGPAPTVVARSSNQYLLPDANLGVGRTARTHSLSMTPVPTRTGTANITVTATDPADGSTSTDTFKVTVTHGQLVNGGFETGMAPWTTTSGQSSVEAAAARTGTRGLRVPSSAYTEQVVRVEPNTTYTLGGWGRTHAAGGSFHIGVFDVDSNQSGPQTVSTPITSTSWSNKEVVFTTGRSTRQVQLFASNVLVSTTGFDVDDLYLTDGPHIAQIPDQSIGHVSCIRPVFYVGRVGNETDPWTVSAAVTAGNPALITDLRVESTNPANLWERGLRITPTSDPNLTGEVTITVTVTDREGRTNTDSFKVWVNAGTFSNGSFEYRAIAGDRADGEPPPVPYPGSGCSPPVDVWNQSFYIAGDWRRLTAFLEPLQVTAHKNYSMLVTYGEAYQEVTGLRPNTVYVLRGWMGLEHGNRGDGDARLRVMGDVSPVNGGPLDAHHISGPPALAEITFRTGASGTASVWMGAVEPEGQDQSGGRFDDITLLPAS